MAKPVINTSQPIIGLEPHTGLPPYPPAPVPHTVVWSIGGSEDPSLPYFGMAVDTSRALRPSHDNKPVMVGNTYVVRRGHDAGPHDGHSSALLINAFSEVITLGAGCKAEFGSSTVGGHGSPMSIAVNCFGSQNMQLDCADPAPLPSGAAMANIVTVVAGFTKADFAGGMAAIAYDTAVTALVSFIAGGLAEAALSETGPLAPVLAPYLAWTIGAYGIGSPLGWSWSHSKYGQQASDGSDAVNSGASGGRRGTYWGEQF